MPKFRWSKDAGATWNYVENMLPYELSGVLATDTVIVESIGAAVSIAGVVLPGLTGVNGIVTHGDSLTAHQIANAMCWPTQLQRQTTKKVKNAAKSGYRVDQLNTLYDTDVGPLYNSASYNTLIFLGGTNDIIQGADASTIQTRLGAYWTKVKSAGWKLVGATIPAMGNIDAGKETIRQTVNTWIKANYASYGVDQLADLAANAKLSNSNDTTYYQSDKLHFTTAGSTAELETIFPLLGLPVEMGTLSSNLIPDGDFASAGSWILETGWSVAGGKASVTPGTAGKLQRSVGSLPAGSRVMFQWDLLDYSAGIALAVVSGHAEPSKGSNGTWYECFVLDNAATLFEVWPNSSSSLSVANVSFYLIT